MNIPSRLHAGLPLILAVILALLLGACADQSRPSVASWQAQWDEVVASIPQEAAVGEAPADDLCTEVLTTLRKRRPLLTPTPDLAIDDAVQGWFQIAEDAFFECPPRSELIGSFADAYHEMSRLEAEIDLVLGLDG